MTTTLETGWQKNAAAATQSDADTEKAFLDQAWMQIQNKSAPLMKAQHRVGFEIVHKNDENTRMVGVFVFRINQDYLFAPVFFINGSIKGTDLLYRANTKKFVPLNNEWCDYLIQLQTSDEGHGVSMKQRQMVRDQLNMLDIVEPPQMSRYIRKYASVCDTAEESSQIAAGINEMLVKLANIPDAPKDSILRKFIINHGGQNAIRKIANTAKHDYEFARALMLGSKPDNYMPDLVQPQAKEARGPLVTVHTSVLRNGNVKKASAKEMCQGYRIEDHRKEAEVNDIVYTDNCSEISTVESSGVYDILLADGTLSKCLVGFEFDVALNGPSCSPSPICADFDPSNPHLRRQALVVVDIKSRASELLRPSSQEFVFGKYLGKVDDSGELIDMSSAKAGEGYRIFDTKALGFSQPFYVKEVGTDPSGLKSLTICEWNTGNCNDKVLLVNPDFRDYDAKDNIFGSQCKLVRVDFKTEKGGPYDNGERIIWNCTLGLGNKHTLNAFIFENNFKSATVKLQPNGMYIIKSARTDGRWSQELSEVSAKVKLMLDCSLREEAAEGVIKMAKKGVNVYELHKHIADKRGMASVLDLKKDEITEAEMDEAADAVRGKSAGSTYSFLYDGTKSAHNLRFNDWPQFYDRMNSEFNVLEAPRSEHVLAVREDKPIVERHRVGDVWRQDGDSTETLDTLNPMELYGMAQEKGIGNLFEHGVVGELTKTYDAITMVQSYIPDFEQALDRLGRILFLFYWKPEDFAQAYGTDDQTSLENKLVSNFRAIGEMTLELLQKAKLQQQGTVSLT